MKITEFLNDAQVEYAINPCTFISQLKTDYVLVFQEILSMEDIDHFTIGTKIATKHTKKSLNVTGRPVHIDNARRLLTNAITAGIKDTLIVYTLDHNGNQIYLGLEEEKPFKIFSRMNPAQIHDVIRTQDTRFACTFELLSGMKDVASTCINLGVCWSSSKFELLQKPGVDALAMLYVDFVNGEVDVETHEETQHLWKSIHDLERFSDAWRNGGKFNTEISPSCKSERILSFLQDYCKNELLEADDLSRKKRQDYDFTDYFWEFVQDINSRDDLVQVMTALVEALETQALIPYISAANKTKFAKTLSQHVSLSLKNICKKEEQERLFDVYDSWIQDPFALLLDLGMRKCFLDILFHFKDFNFLQTIPVSPDIESLKAVLSLVDLSTCLSNHALGLPHDLHMHILKSLLSSNLCKFSLSIELSGYSSKVLGWIQNTCASFDFNTWSVNDGTSFCCLDMPTD